MTGTFVCLLGGLAIGWGATRPRMDSHPVAAATLAVALAPGLGFGLASLLLVAGIALHLPRPSATIFLLIAGAIGVLAHRGSRGAPALAAPRSSLPRPSVPGALGAIAAGIALALVLDASAQATRAWPDGSWDAVAVWNVRARFLHRAYADAPPLVARSSIAVDHRTHTSYPLLLSGAVAAQYGFQARESPAVASATALSFLIGTGLLAFAICARHDAWAAGFWAAAFLYTRAFVKWGIAEVADVPISYYLLAASAALTSRLRRSDEPPALAPWLAGALLGLLGWTKNEGLLYAVLALALLVVALLRKPDRLSELRRMWMLLLGLLPSLLLFVWVKVALPESDVHVFFRQEWRSRVLEANRWLLSLQAIGERFRGQLEWGYAWAMITITLVVAASRFGGRQVARACGFNLAIVTGCMLTWLPIWVLSPYDPQRYIADSVDRLLVQIYPTALVTAVLACVLPLRWRARETATTA